MRRGERQGGREGERERGRRGREGREREGGEGGRERDRERTLPWNILSVWEGRRMTLSYEVVVHGVEGVQGEASPSIPILLRSINSISQVSSKVYNQICKYICEVLTKYSKNIIYRLERMIIE